MAQTPHMALDLLEQSQAQKEVTVNEALFRLDAVLNSGARDRGLNTPPGSPLEGDVYIIGASPTGLWAGKANQVTYFHQIWRFIAPNAGLLVWVMDEAAHYVFNGTSWIAAAVSGGGGGGSGDMAKAAYDGANINEQIVGVSATQTLTNKTISGSNNTISNINLTTSVTGALPSANGGTGLSSPGISGNVLTSNGTVWVSQAPSGGTMLGAFRNLIINGDFSINQRGVTSVANDNYHLDRWYALHVSGTITIAQQVDQENGQPYNLRITQPDATAKRMGVAQIIEGKNCKHLRGQSVCFSARVRCSNTQLLRYAILEWTGAEDNVTSDVVNNWSSTSYTAGGFFIGTSVVVVATGNVSATAGNWLDISGSGTISGSANNIVVVIWSENTLAQNVAVDVGLAQLEKGNFPTAFERRSYGAELDLCKRYFQYFGSDGASGTLGVIVAQAYSATNATMGLLLPVEMRIAPTAVSVSSASDFNLFGAAGANLAPTLIALVNATRRTLRLTATVASGLSAGDASIFTTNATTAKISLNGAEL